jgi:hypothetical protein
MHLQASRKACRAIFLRSRSGIHRTGASHRRQCGSRMLATRVLARHKQRARVYLRSICAESTGFAEYKASTVVVCFRLTCPHVLFEKVSHFLKISSQRAYARGSAYANFSKHEKGKMRRRKKPQRSSQSVALKSEHFIPPCGLRQRRTQRASLRTSPKRCG